MDSSARRNRRWLGAVAMGSLVAGMAGMAAQGSGPQAKEPQGGAGVTAAEAASAGTPRRLDEKIIAAFAGNRCVTRPAQDAVMGFSLPTQITEMLAKGGQKVTAGQMLLRGDDREESATVRLQKMQAETDLPVQRAKAAADLAELEYHRLKDIKDKGGSGLQEVERARLTFETSRIDWELAKIRQAQEVLTVERMESRLDRLRLKAPFNGIVDAILVDVGQAVSENEKVLRVVDISKIEMDVGSPTEDPRTWKLAVGDKAWVLLDVAGSPRLSEGRVDEVAPTADLGSRSRRIRVVIDNPEGPAQLIAGEPAWVRFSEPTKEVIEMVRVVGGA